MIDPNRLGVGFPADSQTRSRCRVVTPLVPTGLRFARHTATATAIFVAIVALRWSAGVDGSAGFDLLLATVAVGLVLANLVGLFVLADTRPLGER